MNNCLMSPLPCGERGQGRESDSGSTDEEACGLEMDEPRGLKSAR